MSESQKLPSFAVLRCFEMAARYESFTAAAEDLGMTQGAVSRHVRDFEAFVGAALFRREGRGVRLTDAGEALARQLNGDLGRLRQTLQHAVAAGEGRRLLRLAAPPTFSSRWLVPRLRSFRDLFPDVELILQSRSAPFDLTEARIDLAIHFGGWDWPGAQLTPLCPEDLVVAAAPELARTVSAQRPAEIQGLPLLHMTDRPHLWERFFASVQTQGRPLRGGSHFDQFNLVISAAVAGMGAAILPTYLIEAELQNGQLLQLATMPEDKTRSYFVATPPEPPSALTREFSSWLHAQILRPASRG